MSATIRDWSKSIGWGGLEERGGGLSVFEPLVRGGSCNFHLSMGGRSSYFLRGISTHFSANLQVEFHLKKESNIQDFSEKYVVD